MYTIALTITTLAFAGLGLFLYLECRDKDIALDRYEDRLRRLTRDLHASQQQLHVEVNNKQRLLIRNQQLAAQVGDQRGVERRLVHQLDALLTQHEQLQIDHAKHVLGATVLPDDGRGTE